MDIRLSSNLDGTLGNDMEIVNGDLSFADDKLGKAQDIAMNLRTFVGEPGTVYDTTAGIPWTQIIFRKGTTSDTVLLVIQDNVLRRAGVNSTDLTVTIDTATRVATATGTIDTDDGNIDFSDIIGAIP